MSNPHPLRCSTQNHEPWAWKRDLLMTLLLIYKDTILTEEQFKAHHDFFARRYNIDIWKSSPKQSTPFQRCWWRDKRIIQDDNVHTLFRTQEWDIVKRMWKLFTCEQLKLPLKSKLISKCARTVFEIKIDFKVDLKSRLHSWVDLKSRLILKRAKTHITSDGADN